MKGMNEGQQLLNRIGLALHRCLKPLGTLLLGKVKRGQRQFLFTLEMPIDPPFLQPLDRHDIIDRRAGVAALIKQRRCLLDDVLAGLLALGDCCHRLPISKRD